MKLAGREHEEIVYEREAQEYTFAPNKKEPVPLPERSPDAGANKLRASQTMKPDFTTSFAKAMKTKFISQKKQDQQENPCKLYFKLKTCIEPEDENEVANATEAINA